VFELGGSQVSIGNASIAEGNSGTKTLNLAVTRGSGASGFTVGYAVTGGTAAAGTDYTLASGTLTFTSGGSDSQNIAITVNGDNVVETDETVLVSLSNVVNVTGQTTIGAATGTATITNDDIAPVIATQPSAPAGGILESGGTTLAVSATGTGLSYQWKKDGSDIVGATAASYTATTSGSYTVVITNAAGSVTSAAIVLTSPVTLPVITVQPSGGVLANGSATLSVTATGSGLTYQWSRGSAVVLGANASEFTAFVTGSYSVTVTNSAGSVTSQTAVVTAEVKPSIDLASITGEFQGLLEPVSSSDAGQHGLITATIAKPIGKNQVSVIVSGKVRRASGTQSFIGRIDASGNVAFTSNNLPWLNISGTNGARLTLEVVASSGGSVIEGKLTRAGVDLAELTAKRTVVPTTSQRGRYTAGLELEEGQASGLPEGDGHATTFVSATGAAFVARLADGSSTSSAMKITESDDAPLFAPLYSGKGLLLGMVRFAQNESGNDASSAGMRWFRSANLLSPSGFKDGWPTGLLLNLAAEKYDSTKGFGLANVSGLTLNFSAEGADLVNDVSGVVTLSSKNVLTATPGSVKLSTALNATTGLITGSFTLPNAKVATKFSAVVLQKSGAATGFFINGSGLQTKSGLIQITE
jgi:hypothetical protein